MRVAMLGMDRERSMAITTWAPTEPPVAHSQIRSIPEPEVPERLPKL